MNDIWNRTVAAAQADIAAANQGVPFNDAAAPGIRGNRLVV